MKVNIWIKKEEVLSDNITKYYLTEPVSNLKDPDKYDTDYVQVSITRDEFVRLEDKEYESKDNDQWKVDQYNRNRLANDMIDNIDQIESDQDSQPFAD